MKETLDLLSQAIAVISKVQLLEKQKTKAAFAQAKSAALVQVHALVQRIKLSPRFHSVMQKDLYDMLGAFESVDQPKHQNAGAFLAGLPWDKSEEQEGKEANPNAEH